MLFYQCVVAGPLLEHGVFDIGSACVAPCRMTTFPLEVSPPLGPERSSVSATRSRASSCSVSARTYRSLADNVSDPDFGSALWIWIAHRSVLAFWSNLYYRRRFANLLRDKMVWECTAFGKCGALDRSSGLPTLDCPAFISRFCVKSLGETVSQFQTHVSSMFNTLGRENSHLVAADAHWGVATPVVVQIIALAAACRAARKPQRQGRLIGRMSGGAQPRRTAPHCM